VLENFCGAPFGLSHLIVMVMSQEAMGKAFQPNEYFKGSKVDKVL